MDIASNDVSLAGPHNGSKPVAVAGAGAGNGGRSAAVAGYGKGVR